MGTTEASGGQTRIRVGILGPLASLDLILADNLLSIGVDATVLRHPSSVATLEDELRHFAALSSDRVVTYTNELHLVRMLREFEFVYSYSATLGFEARHYLRIHPLLRRLGWPPFMNICSGSDIMELALAKGRGGRVERLALRRAFSNNISNAPGALRASAILRLSNAHVAPGIFVVPSAAGASDPGWRRTDDELVLFHPTHLDWGVTDHVPGRVSTKGNDRLLRGVALAATRTSRPLRLVLVDRGADREVAKQLVDELGLRDRVTWSSPLSRPELFAGMLSADLVADQFDVGTLGGIAFEALALGRPVLTYMQPNCNALNFDVPTPVLNARTEEEIAQQLVLASEPAWLEQQADAVKTWISARPSSQFLPRYVFPLLLATGRSPIDFGWGANGELADSF